MEEYHEYIYDLENRAIKGDFEGAYKNCDSVWPTQQNMQAPHFSYIRGLLLEKRKRAESDLTVLDIGCGYGFFVNDLAKLGIGKVVGYDISPSAISKGKRRFGEELDLRVGSLSDINFPEKRCDVVLLMGVLWFLLDDLDSAFKKIKALLKDSGECLITLNVPRNPIGQEIIGSYRDLTACVAQHFTVIDAFHWYQPNTISNGEFSMDFCNMLLRCKK